jgi:LCP family protein required for cell wall assembly
MDRKQRQQSGSIDGFVRPVSQKPVSYLNQQSIRQTQAQPKPVQPHNQETPKKNEPFATNYSPYASGAPKSSIKLKQKRKKWSRRRKIISSVLSVLVLGIGIGGWYGSSLVANLDKVFHGNVLTDAKAVFSHTTLKGEAQGRVNILLAGDSSDDPNHPGANLTDSIMIVSIDTKNHTGFMLSVPRDLWVNIPALGGDQKINDANTVNNFSEPGYPSGGMGQLQQIVQTDLGIPIDYYALIDYTAFRDAVNAVGGVTINLQTNDPRGLFDPNIDKADGGPLKLPNGIINLNGQTALNLARARGDPCECGGQVAYGFSQSDYDRTEHQRQMLTALVQKAQTLGVAANPIKVSQLFNAFGNNIQTNLNLGDAVRLTQLTKVIGMNNLKSLEYSDSGQNALITDYNAPDGEEALAPAAGLDDFSDIQQYYQQLTSNNPVVQEAPTVVVLNGTNTNGLAAQEAKTLKGDGFNVVGVTDANNLYTNSMIIDLSNGKKPASKQLLQTLLSRDTTVVASDTGSQEAAEAVNYNADFVIVLGSDDSTQTP